MRRLKLDIATVDGHTPQVMPGPFLDRSAALTGVCLRQLITEGLVPYEIEAENANTGAGLAWKWKRERGFPLALLERAYTIDIEAVFFFS